MALVKLDQVECPELDPDLCIQLARNRRKFTWVWPDRYGLSKILIPGSGFGTFPLVLTGYSTIAETAAYHHAHKTISSF